MRYQAQPKDTARKLFIDLMNHYRFRVDVDINYGFIQELRKLTRGYSKDPFYNARDIIYYNVTCGASLDTWAAYIENPIFNNVVIPKTLPDLIETGEQLATMAMVAGIPYLTEVPTNSSSEKEEGLFIAYAKKLGHGEAKTVIMPLQWTMAFILAALGVAYEDIENQVIHNAKVMRLMR